MQSCMLGCQEQVVLTIVINWNRSLQLILVRIYHQIGLSAMLWLFSTMQELRNKIFILKFWVLNRVISCFAEVLKSARLISCSICSESWLSFDADSETCQSCKKSQKRREQLSSINFMLPGAPPAHLPLLSNLEESLIALHCPIRFGNTVSPIRFGNTRQIILWMRRRRMRAVPVPCSLEPVPCSLERSMEHRWPHAFCMVDACERQSQGNSCL